MIDEIMSSPLILSNMTIIDPSKLFPDRSFPANGETLDLSPLKNLVASGAEFFLPRQLYVRQEMRQLFQELTEIPVLTKIVSGSPGIGKSVTCFLTALYRAWNGKKSVFFFRWTKNSNERASAFLICKNDAGSLQIQFARDILKNRGPQETYNSLLQELPDTRDVYNMVDGLLVTEVEFVTELDTLCTSGRGDKITSEKSIGPIPDWEEIEEERQRKVRLQSTANIVMGAWQVDDMKCAITACCVGNDERFDEELFEEIYYVTGGRIREAVSMYRKKEVSTIYADNVVKRVSVVASAKLALARTDQRSTSDHVDALRSIFRRPMQGDVWDEVDIIVDSQYMIHKLHEKVDGEELLNSYHSARDCGYYKAAADYFEELMHWQLSQPGVFPSISDSLKGQGTASEGVQMLKTTNCYWMPSTPNFVNIDAAIVRPDMHVWCFQYTTGQSHTYKKRRLRPKFLNVLNQSFVQQVQDVTVIFVVPTGTTFSTPDTGGECNTKVVTVDCENMDVLRASLTNLIETVATTASVATSQAKTT